MYLISNTTFQHAAAAAAKSLQSCPTLCDPIDCSLPGSSVHGILQARILEWVAISFPRGSSRPRDRTCTSYLEADPNHWTTREFPGVFYAKRLFWGSLDWSWVLNIENMGKQKEKEGGVPRTRHSLV